MRLSLTLVIGVLSLALLGCDATDADPLLPTRATLTLDEINRLNVNRQLVVNVQGDSDLRTPTNVSSDTLVLIRGRQYAGQIEFFNAEGDNITFALRDNADLVEVTYNARGVPPFSFVRTDSEDSYDADLDGIDLAVGLQFEIEVPFAFDRPLSSQGDLGIQVLEYAAQEKALAGEAILWSAFTVPLALSQPNAATEIERITGLRINLTNPSGGVTSGSYSNQQGLQNGAPAQPAIQLSNGTTYRADIELDGILQGEGREINLTGLIREEGIWYQAEYTGGSGLETSEITDLDRAGRPIGLSFTFSTRGGGNFSTSFPLRLRLYRYEALNGKDTGAEATRRVLVDLLIQLRT
ncbi:MAG: hypothetical protein AAGJ10_15105 [Bacteroidota bacterium]